MPIYEYRCAKCGKVFEVLQKFSDEPLKKHEKCGGRLEKLISAPGLQFKGEGWYITDYARAGSKGKEGKESTESEKKSSESSSEPSSAATSTSDNKAESKTESKSETKSVAKPPKRK